MTLVALGALWPLVDADSVHASMFAGIATIGGFGVMGVAAVLASSDRAFPTVALYLLVCVLVAERAPRRGLHVLERDVAA